VADDREARLPSDARACVIVLAAQLDAAQTMLRSLDKRIMKQHRANEASRRLETIPGIGIRYPIKACLSPRAPPAMSNIQDIRDQLRTGANSKIGIILPRRRTDNGNACSLLRVSGIIVCHNTTFFCGVREPAKVVTTSLTQNRVRRKRACESGAHPWFLVP
jgi:hypothetical protein